MTSATPRVAGRVRRGPTRVGSTTSVSWALPAALLAPMALFVLGLFVLPFVMVVTTAFTDAATDSWSLTNFQEFFSRSVGWTALRNTLIIGVGTTVVAAAVAVPYAYGMVRHPRWRALFIAVLFAPLLINGVVRVFGYQLLARFVDRVWPWGDLPLLYSLTGVVISLVVFMFPQMTVAVFASLDRMDRRLVDAAQTLGAGNWQVFRTVVLPAARPGIVAGSIITFGASAGSYLAPAMVGGGRVPAMPTLIYGSVSGAGSWNFGAAVAVVLMAIILPLMILSLAQSTRRSVP
ncbi:hypothetical protein BHE97_04400 [Aeromicrobium sp. PE09-221]|uniref:ABC transporter permease n=1 Tax=Aeromicrobium sp. PE09-221 TaxID=1898043 RepID=UPI000B748C9A|nr:ABC transporter permease [Aeromicrobium sp. PE09-221]OUZ11585.1 hypothetical protein BHE97_04400 [Aeromicrobium sp. PE09-221]